MYGANFIATFRWESVCSLLGLPLFGTNGSESTLVAYKVLSVKSCDSVIFVITVFKLSAIF